MNGHFFVFDGMDGAGKSTALQGLAERLRGEGRAVFCTREPGGSELAEAIRECMLRDWTQGMPIQTELLLVFAARAAHLQHSVEPALARGDIVLCDRFIDSSYVYQAILGGVDSGWIDELVSHTVTQHPERYFIFDLPAEVACRRLGARGHDNRFDRIGLDRLERVRQGFAERARACPHSHLLVDAQQAPERVVDVLRQALAPHLS